MDILRVLSSPDQEVRKKTLTLALDLVTSRNIEEVNVSAFTKDTFSVTLPFFNFCYCTCQYTASLYA